MPKKTPVCGYTLDGVECCAVGDHFCIPRADHAQAFFEEILQHTKGRYVRRKFILADWQRDDIIRPLFGRVVWSAEYDCYRRRYEVAYLEVARKNGKALDIATPMLTGDGWKKMGELVEGDYVHAIDGSLARVSYVSEIHNRDCYAVKFGDGAELVASDHHLWSVYDRKEAKDRVVDTAELYATQFYGKREDRRYRVAVPAPLDDRATADLPIDPYIFGVWLGDGSSYKAEFTSADPEIWDAIEAAGYTLTYSYPTGKAVTRGVLKMKTTLKEMGVIKNKHVPDNYLLASRQQRLALLRGLMDSDGCVCKGTTPRVEFTSTKLPLAEAVQFLARSLGWKVTMYGGRATLYGKDCGPKYRVCWTAYSHRSPFALPRKTNALADAPIRPTRSSTNAIVSVTPVPAVETVCIQIDHPSHVFLAGESLTPTHNTELLAGMMLYLLIADSEESAEIYGVARDITQAKLAFDVAAQMVKFSPVLSKRLQISDYKKRIYDPKKNGFYQVIASDAKSALGSNPSGVGADELLAWDRRDMWDSLRTGMGSGARLQPLMIAATTAGNDSEGFAGDMHRQMEKALEDLDAKGNRHVFIYMRNTPKDADPWDPASWPHANPALGDFLSMEKLEMAADEARANPIAEMAFRQFRLNQWQSSTVRWMSMFLWDKPSNRCYPAGEKPRFDNNEELLSSFAGCECWFGLDLAAKQDLCSVCYLFPSADATYGVDVVWRHFAPQAAVDKLDRLNSGRFTNEFQKGGWLTVTPGEVLDFEQLYAAIAVDSERFSILGGDSDKYCSEPVIQRIRRDTGIGVEDIFAYDFQFGTVSDGMHRVFDMVTDGIFRHHANPLARFCFDATEARYKSSDPDLIMPDKPSRMRSAKRIDAVSSAILAVNAWWSRDYAVDSVYNERDVIIL